MIRRRWWVLAAWLVVLVVSGIASAGLSDLLTNRFTLPGTDTATGGGDPRGALRPADDRLVHGRRARRSRAARRRSCPQVRAAAERAAAELPTSRLAGVAAGLRLASSPRRSSRTSSPPTRRATPTTMREAAGTIPGAELYVTGQAAIEHDLDPVFADDLRSASSSSRSRSRS